MNAKPASPVSKTQPLTRKTHPMWHNAQASNAQSGQPAPVFSRKDHYCADRATD